MSTMSVARQPVGSVARRPASGTLAEVIDIILDKGLVIDAYVRVSLVGIELLTVDVRVVVASVDTYLHFAEAVNRLDLTPGQQAPKSLPDLFSDTTEDVSAAKTKGAIEGGIDKLRSTFGGDREEAQEEA